MQIKAITTNIQGRLRVPGAAGARFPLRAHLFSICMFLHRGRFWSLKYFPEGQCLVFGLSYTMAIWGLEACPQKKILEPSCLQRRKTSLHKIGEMERVQHED